MVHNLLQWDLQCLAGHRERHPSLRKHPGSDIRPQHELNRRALQHVLGADHDKCLPAATAGDLYDRG